MFLLGFVIDIIEIIFVVVPLTAPTLLALGIDPVWLGVLFAVNLQTSFLTPPFGFALFYLRGVAPPTLRTVDIYRGVMPFIALQVLMLVILCLWPALVTWLPGVMATRRSDNDSDLSHAGCRHIAGRTRPAHTRTPRKRGRSTAVGR